MAGKDLFKHKINTKSTNLLTEICSRKKVYLLVRPSTLFLPAMICAFIHAYSSALELSAAPSALKVQ